MKEAYILPNSTNLNNLVILCGPGIFVAALWSLVGLVQLQ